WSTIKERVFRCDAVIFACLAIRNEMATKQYPYIKKLLSSNIPLYVISAGTAVPINVIDKAITSGLSLETKKCLQDLDKKAVVFGTRGYLSQLFMEKVGSKRSHFTGDIAFYDKKWSEQAFRVGYSIKKIVISDPHYAGKYINALEKLVDEISETFPKAELTIALHGNESIARKFAENRNISYKRIYEDKQDGLNIYDDADLHVGFRVHGHVSMLKRRKYSYLLEQDGRGCDYGLTIDRKISIPCYRTVSNTGIYILDKVFNSQRISPVIKKTPVDLKAIDQMVALIQQDKDNDFRKFLGLEKQLESFVNLLCSDVSKLP
ncbi:hypothetical protein BZG11_15455, partial [Salinivibrio kushneri]|uniref:polysaccharide pyruvyl transferase family protein n=1 Tax=Salinivibrio kushneri TaxID=1908198 RepID=UPI0009D3B807